MNVNDGGSAFPQPLARDAFGNLVTAADHPAESVSGMSLRDYFAGQAVAGVFRCIVSEGESATLREASQVTGTSIEEIVALAAYNIADAMLAVREKAGGAS